MLKKMFILVLFSSVLSGCSLGTAKVYRVQSNADLLSAKTSRKLDKQLFELGVREISMLWVDFKKEVDKKSFKESMIFGFYKNLKNLVPKPMLSVPY